MVRPRQKRLERRQGDIERARALYNKDIDALRLEWLAAHIERQNRRCVYCGVTMLTNTLERTDPRRATLDHRVARARGGADSLANTAAACLACNTSKRDTPAERFRKIRMSAKRNAT